MVKDIKAGTNWVIPTQTMKNADEFEPINTLFSALDADNMALSTELISKELGSRHDKYTNKFDHTTHHQLEYKYAKLRLPLVALFLTILAIACFTLFKKDTIINGRKVFKNCKGFFT